MLEGCVVRIDNHLRDDGRTGFVDATGGKFALHGLLQMITNVALRHGATLGERHCGRLSVVVVGVFKREVHHAHLRAVSVADDHVVALFHEVHNSSCCILNEFQLLFRIVSEGVASKSYYKTFVHFAI